MKTERRFDPEPLWIARRRKNLKQSELATALKLSRLTIIRAERGSPLVTQAVLETICACLGVPFTDLHYQETFLSHMSQID